MTAEAAKARRVLMELLTESENPMPKQVAAQILSCLPISLISRCARSREAAEETAQTIIGDVDWQKEAQIRHLKPSDPVVWLWRLDALILRAQQRLRREA